MNHFAKLLILLGVFTPVFAFAEIGDVTHYYAFDDATGNSIADTVGANGVLIGTSTGMGWAGGKSGTALGLDGTAGTGVALPDGMLTGSAGSISVWLKITEHTDRNIILSGRSVSDQNVFMALGVNYEGRIQVVFRTDPSGVNRKVQIEGVLNTNEWYHLVLTASGQSYQAYVNGEARTVTGDNIGRWFPDVTNQALSYRIGISEASPMLGSFSGLLDELRTYARPLTMDEANALYAIGNTGTPTVPMALRPRMSLTVTPESVLPGESVTISWNSAEVDSCVAEGAWQGTLPKSGTRTEVVSVNAEYRLSCFGKNGSTNATARVAVGGTHTTATPPTVPVTEVVLGGKPSSVSSYAFTRNLTVGSRGADVVALQEKLIALGHLTPGLSTGYFGGMTKSALAKMQAQLGLPATGFFGPMTRAKLAQ